MTRWRMYGIAALIAVLLIAVAAAVGWCVRDRAARQSAAQAQRAADDAALRAAGAIVAERASRERVESEAADLRDQLARLRAAVPSVEVREVERWRTETAPASYPIEEPVVAGCGVPTRPCVLRAGDPVEVRGVEARVESSSGATAMVGQAEVWSGTRKIASAPFAGGILLSDGVPRGKAAPKWAASAGYGWSSRGPVWLAGIERRIAGPAWLGVEGGAVGGDAMVAARVMVEW